MLSNSQLFRTMKIIYDYVQSGGKVPDGWEDWSDNMIILLAAQITNKINKGN